MRAPGRFWWGWLFALPVEAAAAVGLLWLLWPPLNWLVWLFLAVVSVAGAVFLVASTVNACWAYRRWLAAIATAMRAHPTAEPGAREQQPSVPPPALALERLPLLWRFTRSVCLLIACATGCFVVSIYEIIHDTIPLLMDKGAAISGPFAQLGNEHNHLTALVIPVTALLLIPVIVYPVVARPFGIVATEGGVELWRMLGRRRQLRWEDVVLFQLVYDGDRYLLFTRRGYITWRWFRPTEGSRPLGMSHAEAAIRRDTLLAVIEQRTGLVLQRSAR